MASSDTEDNISVADFYEGKSVFITGATGFIGKVLVEKLLWSCPGIEKIFLLIRSKKNEDEESRLANVLGTPVFDRLRYYRPNDLKKIFVISGDLSKPCLGINPKDQDILIRTASVVFHVAATVRFNEPLKAAVTINTTATKHLAELCSLMPNIKAFVYMSTAYCNCDRQEVDEEIYNNVHDPESIIQLVTAMDDDTIDALTPKLVGERPNTYSYTKALAESLLQNYHKKIPIAVVRPSIVLSTMAEPFPGWLEGWNGPSPFIAAAVKGLLHGLLGNPSVVGDFIPADIVVNLTICAAWRTAMQGGIQKIEVYNCCTGERNPVTWGNFVKYCSAAAMIMPPAEIITYPFFSFQSHSSIRFIQQLFLEQLPAFFVDLIYRLLGKNAVMLKMHAQLLKANNAMSFALFRQWQFRDNNTHHLLTILKKEDQQIFPFDVCNIDWPTYFKHYYQGIRHYLLKD
ncbi:Putative fatty acyl-CoA reductase CG5065, partial [Gryllus bimaculatus]